MPIIFVAADPGSKARGHALASGALAFLTKPFREEKLIALLDEALSGRGAESLPSADPGGGWVT
jgi:CheY-like chemotaxis protein